MSLQEPDSPRLPARIYAVVLAVSALIAASPAMATVAPVAGVVQDPVADTLIRATLIPDTIQTVRLDPELQPGDPLSPIPVEGVVVEILRSPIRISNAPFAISVLQREIAERGRSNSSIDEALQGLPGVQVQNRFNDAVGERISIRGFGARSPFGVRGIRILVDGIPATLPDGQSNLDHLDLGSLGRVEALRGPGSALYGNASGGVLDFRTRAPADSPVRSQFRDVSGDFGMRQSQVTLSGRRGDAGYFANVSRYVWQGYRRKPGDPAGDTYGSTLRRQANGYAYAPVLGGEARVTMNALDLTAENPGALGITGVVLGTREASANHIAQRAGRDVRQGQLGLTWTGPARGRQLDVSIYGIRREMTHRDPAEWLDLDRRAAGVRTLLRTEARSEMGPVWWAVGFESDLQVDDRRSFTNEAGDPGSPRLDQRERVFGGAVFIQALLPIAPILDVLTGLRYDRIRFSARDRLGSGAPDDSGARTMDSASPSFGLHAAFHRAFGAYVNLSTAFETPTTSELAIRPDGEIGFNPDLEPQVGITTELGARGLVGNSAAWELTYFHTVLYNELVPFELSDQADRRYFRNSGRSRRDGWEATIQLDPHPVLGARLVLSTNDARFRDYEVEGTSYRGNRVPGLSPRRVEGILRFGPGRWFLELRGESSAAIPGNDANDPGARSPAYWLADFRAGGNEIPMGPLRFSPFLGITNLFDNHYNTSVIANAARERYFEPGPGRGVYFGAAIAIER